MKSNELEKLMTERSECCVTIVIPTDRLDHKRNLAVFRTGLLKAKALLKNKTISDRVKTEVTKKLDESIFHMPDQVMEGLGVFVSPVSFSIVTLPFDVKAKVDVSSRFEIRDLLYLAQYTVPYYVINLSKKGAQLFRATLYDFEEIRDGKFPFTYEDQFEYQRATLANASSGSLKGFEKDKNEISDIRLKAVFREADAALTKYLTASTTVLLAGTQKTISLFKSVTGHKANVSGKVSGSFSEKNRDKLPPLAWKEYVRGKREALDKQVHKLESMNGEIAEGIREAWTAAQAGKGLTLMVEKDFHHRGYRKDGVPDLYLQPPKKPYQVIPDAVDELIAIVKEKNGKVLFTENDKMRDLGHLALQLRY